MNRTDSELTDDGWGELLAAAQRGESQAYRAFLQSAAPFARALVRRDLWSHEGVEDVVQDVLLTVHRVRHTYQPGRPVKPWLAAIVRRRAIDALRKRGRVAAHEVHDEAAYETSADSGANKLEVGESARAVHRMVETLPPKQKEAIELVKLKEMSLVEASAASGQSVAALKVNVHRALKRLRLAFGKDSAE